MIGVGKIALMGDSTLDNTHWVKSGESVKEQLDVLFPGKIIDLAVDGFTTKDVLKGGNRGKAVHDDQHIFDETNLYKPLEYLRTETDVTHLVLSVGGNNIRERLGELAALKPEQRQQHLTKLMSGVQTEYLRILENITSIDPQIHPIIMLQYTLDSTNDHYLIYWLMLNFSLAKQGKDEIPYSKNKQKFTPEQTLAAVEQLRSILEELYKPILQHAKEKKIPIIDMASSFNHADSTLYKVQIEPSKSGGAIITELITHVVNNHDFTNDSLIYSKPFDTPLKPIVINNNHEAWRPYKGASVTEEKMDDPIKQATNTPPDPCTDSLSKLRKYQEDKDTHPDIAKSLNELIRHVESVEKTDQVNLALQQTCSLLITKDMTPAAYKKAANEAQGHPLIGLSILGGLMLALGLIVAGVLAATGIGAAAVFAAGTVTAVGTFGLIATIGRRKGLSLAMDNVADVTASCPAP